MKFYLLIAYLVLSNLGLLNAQLCNGNLGDPVVNVTFGTSSSIFPSTVTSFDHTNGCPEKGQYTTSNLSLGCGDRTWVLLAGDHTRDMNGQFMLVNAASTQGIIHRDTAKGLCGNMAYQYSAWITNVMQSFSCDGNPILTNISFNVKTLSGAVLAESNTGNIPLGDERLWKQYGLSFITPANVGDLVLTFEINPPYGCGSGFAIDDITFSPCGPAVTATIDGETGPVNVCADYTNPFILKAGYAAGFSDPAVQWQSSQDTGKSWTDIPGATDTTYAIPKRGIGIVLYRMAAAEIANIGSPNCRINSNAISTGVYPLPIHNAPENLIGCIGKDLFLPQADPTELQVEWSGPNGYTSAEAKAVVSNVQYADTGLYQLKQTFYFGCQSLDSFYLKVFPGTTVTAQTLYGICEGKSVTLSASGSGTYKWTPSTGLSNDAIPNPIATPRDSTEYKLIITNSFGCKDSALVAVNVFRNPQVSAGTDKTIVKGDTVLLNGFAQGTAINYSWSPDTYMQDPLSASPKVFPPENIQYTLKAASTVGCGIVTSSVKVNVYNDLYIPSAFTPNGDGKNDEFRLFAADGYKLKKFAVYNRWGMKVFEAKNTADSWDGKVHDVLQQSDTYVYYLQLQKSDGKLIDKKGTITLVR